MAELTKPTRGPEVLAKADGKCRRNCGRKIEAGEDYISKVENVGWMHALCAKDYCDTIAEHIEELEDQADAAEISVRRWEISDAVTRMREAGVSIDDICDDLEAQLDRLRQAA